MQQDPSVVYYKQLDSLRAIAVILVIISHWFTQEHFLNRYTENGILGVTLFFVLSGFLITGILLKNKQTVESGSSVTKAFRNFYLRRSLRIFPLYYVLLIIVFSVGFSDVQESFWWHFFYSSNFYFWLKGEFGGQLSHFWSLAVEEQFYMIWPAIILFIPQRYLFRSFIIGILTAVFFRYIISENSEMGRFLMPGSLDSFCIGGIFAHGRLNRNIWYNQFMNRQWIYVVFAFVILVFIHFDFFTKLPANLWSGLYLFLVSISFGIIINKVAWNIDIPVLKQVLESKTLLYLGKISYGIYLFHNLIPYFYDIQLPQLLKPYSIYVVHGLRFILLILISTFSWYLLEKPFLRLKDRFVV
jgi:peptidoglycan/LPS O-acetylase OafA/YrhL